MCYLVNVLVSWGCCNKAPHTEWLKATEIYPLAVLQTRSLKSRCWQGCAPSESSREESFLSLLAPGVGQQTLVSLA